MVSEKEKVSAEIENITKILNELEKVKDRAHKELVVLVGIGAYLLNIYNGIENIFKHLLLHKGISIPDTPIWHKDLLKLVIEHEIITQETADALGNYLFFRHFFTHTYGFHIEEAKLEPLMNNIFKIYSKFKEEIDRYLEKLEE